MSGASNLTLVTGPSRTGDIEMTLTVGVHGPREMIVALVC
jgi:L-lactate dehydrogenase complex protein LldG